MAYHVSSLVAKHATKGDQRAEGDQVHVECSGHALQVQTVREIAHVEWKFTSNVVDYSSERPVASEEEMS